MTDYQKPWGGAHPGCLIVLLDQSASMDDPFGGTQMGHGKKKADMVATVLNRVLEEFIQASTKGAEISPRADVSVLGYSGTKGVGSALPSAIRSADFVSLPDLRRNPRRIETRTEKMLDDTGKFYEEEVYFNIWVDADADGGTPMCEALRRATDLAGKWAASHRDNYPPVVINVTDGVATDGTAIDVTREAETLRAVSTSDGALLLLNCHITDQSNPKLEFPASESEVPNDEFALMLYRTASEIPESSRTAFFNATSRELVSGTRGYIFNGDADSVRRLLVFASTAAAPNADPNR